MTDKQHNPGRSPTNAATLRKQAEFQARTMEPTTLSTLPPEEIQRILHELRVHQIELEMQNKELRTTQAQIKVERARYFDIYDLAPVGYCTLSEKGLILEANLTAATMLGLTRSALVNQPISRFIFKEDLDVFYYLHRKQLFDPGESQESELRLVKPDGTPFWAHLTATASQAEDGTPICRVVMIDITERKCRETYHEMGQEVLRILNEPCDLLEAIQRIIVVLKTRTGVDAVGMRLHDGDDFPYFSQNGFSQDFLLTENTLIKRGKDGGVCRDKDDNICLECTCGLVISGKADPSDPHFTQRGSFWTNDSFPFLDLPSDQDLRLHPRNICIHQGYASVALIPVRTRERIVGLIQFNGKRKGLFTLETIEVLEGIAEHIGSTLMRKHAEEALRESEERFKALHNASFGGIAIHDQGSILECNQGLSVMTGFDYEELIGMNGLLLMAEQSREAFMNKIRPGCEQPYEAFGLRKNGEEYPLHLEARNIPYKGKMVHVVEFRDITDRKRTEEALKESEFRARAMLKAIPDLMFRLNRHGVYVDYKSDINDLYAQDVPIIIGKHIRDIFPPEFVDLLDEKIRAAFESGSLQTFEYQLPIPGRGVRDYECRMIRSAADETTAIVRDITERRRVEEALRKSEELLTDSQRLSKVGGWGWNVATQTMYWTEETYRIHDFTPGEIAPGSKEHIKRGVECYDPNDRPVILAAFQRCVEEGQPYDLELPFTTAKGRRLWIRTTARPVHENGKVIRVIGNFIDITERKHHEQQLTAALIEKEALLREVHHRVKNNLAAIISLMDMQRRTFEDPNGQIILTELSNRIRSMSLVHEKLYRSDSLATIDFQDYIHALISHLRTTFGSPDIICQIDAPGVTIPLDLASPCGLIVNELVTNALKYAFPNGKPRPGNTDCRILVRLHRDKDTYTLTVADNGIGWPAGFDWIKTKTLGMILVRMLGQHQLGGHYVVDQEEGTSITLTFTDRKKEVPIHG